MERRFPVNVMKYVMYTKGNRKKGHKLITRRKRKKKEKLKEDCALIIKNTPATNDVIETTLEVIPDRLSEELGKAAVTRCKLDSTVHN